MTPHRLLTLTSSVAGAAIVALDGTVLSVAQPTLRRELHASFAQVQWTSTGYLIAVASLLVFSGRLGDRYGHQRVFATGVLGFSAASAGIGLSSGIGWVIGLRVAQGVFGALLQPATLGMLRAAFPPDRLGMPVALRTSAVGVAAAAGPVVGGVLVTQLGWRAVFFLNVVPALVLGALALVVRDPARAPAPAAGVGASVGEKGTVTALGPSPARTPLDVPGACLLAAALACLVHTLVGTSSANGPGGTVLGLLAVLVLGTVFVRHERRTASPLLPAAIRGSATIGAAAGMLVTASAAMLGTLFVGTYFLQDVLGLTPLQSSLRALPGPVMMILGAPLSAMLMRRFGSRRTAVTGMTLLTLGILVLSRLGQGATAAHIGAGFLLLGAGFGAVMVTATAVVVRQAPEGSAGVAGGLQQTAMNVGPTVGVAVATTMITHTGVETGPALAVLACVSALGMLLGRALPGRPDATAGAVAAVAPSRPLPGSGELPHQGEAP
ncbi:MFS transporter [Streptomyces sp. NPDC005907]|uniref:MFS transporter n=1 Tax=Streptomyces sp. NPDC005907 TaxID=3154571 RepID=UPI003402E3F8